MACRLASHLALKACKSEELNLTQHRLHPQTGQPGHQSATTWQAHATAAVYVPAFNGCAWCCHAAKQHTWVLVCTMLVHKGLWWCVL
jgi:hypothetical protein